MSTRRSGLALALALLPLPWGCSGDAPPPPRARNVLLIVADTFRADRLGCYGYDRATSPTIDALAARGTLYEDNHSQSCWTIPSMISLMSGLYVSGPERGMPAYQPTLAEVMRSRGLRTVAFVGNPVLGKDRGLDRGFDFFRTNGTAQFVMSEIVEGFTGWYEGNRKAVEEDGFFAWLHLMDTHSPLVETDWSRAHEPRPETAERLAERWRHLEPEAERLSEGIESLDFEDSVARMNLDDHLYDGEVAEIDAGIREILDFLGEDVLAETLVVFAADHGESRFEHRKYPDDEQLFLGTHHGFPEGVWGMLRSGHRDFLQPVWHTPLIFAGPGFPAGVRVEEGLAANLDIFPTLCAAVGAPVPPDARGEVLLGAEVPRREYVHGFGRETNAVYGRDGLKYLDHPPERFLLPEDAARQQELYDLGADPGERDNVVEARGDAAARYAEVLETWKQANDREIVTRQTREAADVLRNLGYVDEANEDG